MNRLTVAATLAALSAVCAPPQASADPSENGLQEYGSISEFANDLTNHGFPCSITPLGGGAFDVDSGYCYIGLNKLVLSLYTSQSQIDKYLANVVPVMEDVDLQYGWLSGKNWTINCNLPTACKRLQADLGGSITASLPRR